MEYNRRYNDNEACWLVKVDNFILGPFSFNEVLVKLTAGELLPNHEVISPLDRWRSLQAQPHFSAAVEKIKLEAQSQSEHTLTKTMADTTNFTRTLELTIDRSTPTPTPSPSSNEEPLSMSPPAAAEVTTAPIPSHQTYTPPTAKKTSFLLPAISVVALIILGFLGTKLFLSGPSTAGDESARADGFIDYMDRGLLHKRNGEWREALSNFKKAYQLNRKDADLIFEMSPLLIQIENKYFSTRESLEKVMKTQYKKENLALGHNLLGITYSYESNYEKATNHFDEALKNDPEYLPAMINKGFAQTLAGHFSGAKKQFNKTTQISQKNAMAYLYLIEAYILNGTKTGDISSFENAYRLSGQAAKRFYDGRQEMLLFRAYAALKLNKDDNEVKTLVAEALSIDPDQTSLHLHSPKMDWRGLKWSYFTFVCDSLASKLSQGELSLLRFVCTYRSNNEIKAQKEAENWMRRSPKSATPHVAQAIVWYKLGEVSKAKSSLDLAQSLGAGGRLYNQVLIKVCGALEDRGCLDRAGQMVVKISPLDGFLAQALSSKDNQAVYKGLRESDNYLPLLRLQQ